MGAVVLPLLDDAVSLDAQVGSKAGVGIATACGRGALDEVNVVAVLYDDFWV